MRLAPRFIGLVDEFLTLLPAERPKQTPLFFIFAPARRQAREGGLPNWSTGHERKDADEFRAVLLDPRNDRKTPFTHAELDVLADDFIARMADTQAWQNLVTDVGEQQAREVVKQRLAAQGPLH
jgi:hypothetical protein